MILELGGIGILVFLASLAGTVSGFGTSTIMVPVLALVFPLPAVLLFVGIIHWFGDAWKIVLFRSGVRWQLLLWFGVPGILLSYLGASLSLAISQEELLRVLGAFLLGYGAFLVFRPAWKLPQRMGTAAAGGALSGFFAGIFGVGGAVRSAFLASFNLRKEVYIFTSGAIALVIDSTRIATYVLGETQLAAALWWGMLGFIPISFLGAWLAKRIVNRIPQKAFRLVIAAFLLLVAFKFLLVP